MMLVMLQSRMRALLQHITKTHQGSVNNVVRSLTPLVELCKTRRRNLLFYWPRVFEIGLYRRFFVVYTVFRYVVTKSENVPSHK